MLQLLSGFTAGWKFFSPIMSQSHDLELRSWPLTTFLYKVWHILSHTQGQARNYVHVCHTSWFKKGLVPSIQVGPQQRWIVWRSEWMNEWTQFLLQPLSSLVSLLCRSQDPPLQEEEWASRSWAPCPASTQCLKEMSRVWEMGDLALHST